MSFGARFSSPTHEELEALLRMYDAIAGLRDRRDAGGGVAPRGELLALAREFPGALRELDTAPRAEIERRRVELGAALLGGPPAPWMTWLIAYHATMRAALFIKGRLARSRVREVPDDLAREIVHAAALHTGVPVDESFVRAVAKPPARRINAAVFARLGRDLGIPAEEMWQTLFPSRRTNRF